MLVGVFFCTVFLLAKQILPIQKEKTRTQKKTLKDTLKKYSAVEENNCYQDACISGLGKIYFVNRQSRKKRTLRASPST